MKLSLFTESEACRQEAHCETCRSLEGGRKWRRALRVGFCLPNDQNDFECPKSKLWGYQKCATAPSPKLPRPVAKSRKITVTTPTGGPGTELKALLGAIGIEATPTCPCNRHMREMNAWGPDKCERRIEEIVGWLREEAERRKLPFVPLAARVVVRRAIARARKRVA